MEKFFKSPQNVSGVLALVAILPGLVAQYYGHSVGLSAVVSTIAFGIAKILVPDNAVMLQDVDKLIADGIQLYVLKSPAAMTEVLTDAAKTAADVGATAKAAK